MLPPVAWDPFGGAATGEGVSMDDGVRPSCFSSSAAFGWGCGGDRRRAAPSPPRQDQSEADEASGAQQRAVCAHRGRLHHLPPSPHLFVERPVAQLPCAPGFVGQSTPQRYVVGSFTGRGTCHRWLMGCFSRARRPHFRRQFGAADASEAQRHAFNGVPPPSAAGEEYVCS